MTRLSLRRFFSATICLGLVVAACWLWDDESGTPSRWHGRREPPAPARLQPWEHLENVRFVSDPANDGDSFLVRHAGGTHVLRLYFVDCPEKRRHQFNGPRLADQGAYFGGMTESETVRLGREARDFTARLLETSRIDVFTKWEPVFDERRHYAHLAIIHPDGSRHWLAASLVENGLARVFTKGADLPDGTPQQKFSHHLRLLEKAARLDKRGGWARVEREGE
jgi:endonuclease YncB( thermonuclease family)